MLVLNAIAEEAISLRDAVFKSVARFEIPFPSLTAVNVIRVGVHTALYLILGCTPSYHHPANRVIRNLDPRCGLRCCRSYLDSGSGRMCLPFLVARIFRGGMGQGAAEAGKWVGFAERNHKVPRLRC